MDTYGMAHGATSCAVQKQKMFKVFVVMALRLCGDSEGPLGGRDDVGGPWRPTAAAVRGQPVDKQPCLEHQRFVSLFTIPPRLVKASGSYPWPFIILRVCLIVTTLQSFI